MRIRQIRAHVLRHELDQPFQSATSTFRERQACLVEVSCTDGTAGWGECLGPAGPNAAVVEAMGEHLLGRDPLEIEPAWLTLYDRFRDQGQRGVVMTALSGIDLALWDIAGRNFGVPVHVLLGGAFRKRVPAYATGGFRRLGGSRLTELPAEVASYVEEGFRAAKIKIGFDVHEDVEVIRRVRQAVAQADFLLMIDANHGYDTLEAAELGNRVAALGIHWFEEPVVPENLRGYRTLRQRQPLPLAGGETWHGRHAFADAISADAIDILQPNVCGCGGITEMRKIVSLAETAGIRVVPHVWGTGVQMAAALHMLAVLPPHPPRHSPRLPLLEFDRTCNPFRQAILESPIEAVAGFVQVPEGPGLGIRVDRAAVERFRVR